MDNSIHYYQSNRKLYANGISMRNCLKTVSIRYSIFNNNCEYMKRDDTIHDMHTHNTDATRTAMDLVVLQLFKKVPPKTTT